MGRRSPDVGALVAGARDGDPRSVARLISLVEQESPALREVAETTGGRAYDAASAVELREVYDDIGSVLVPEPGREDVSDLFAGVGLVLLLGTAVPSLLWSSRLL